MDTKMSKTKFIKMLDFELRAVLYGNDLLPQKGYVDLRRKNGQYSAHAVKCGYEYEVPLGGRWFKKKVPIYIKAAISGWVDMYNRAQKDPDYKESIAQNTGTWGWFGR